MPGAQGPADRGAFRLWVVPGLDLEGRTEGRDPQTSAWPVLRD